MRKNASDSQSHRYQLTINNPVENSLSHDTIKKILVENFSTFTYCCMADERGSCPHTHVFACFSSRVRFSKIKKHFPTAHIEKVKGTTTDNVNYIKKSGKWENDIKHGTQIEGTFEEWGTRPPDSAGKNADMTALFQMIQDGMTDSEILTANQDYIPMLDKIGKVRTAILIDKYKGQRRLNLEVIYISGETNTGKTRSVLDEFGDANVYRITDYVHPFDGYDCQPIIMFDEFRSSLCLSDMLHYLDIYPIQLPARYANKFACYEKVFIVSNWALEKQYGELQKDDAESWAAFLRRIKQIRVYKAYKKFSSYNSVSAYMNRKENFHPLTDEEEKEIPFDDR